MKMISIGLGNYVAGDHVMAIVSPESAPVKRLIQAAQDAGTVVDATFGRRTKAVIVMDSGQVVLAPIQPQTIIEKVNKDN